MWTTVAHWMQMLLSFQLAVSSLLASIMTEAFCHFCKSNRNTEFVHMFSPNFGWVTIFWATPTFRSWWKSVGIHSWQLVTGSSWWRWWSDTFVHNLHKVKTALICQLWGVVEEISLQSHRYVEWLLYNGQGTSGQPRFFLHFYFFQVPS